MRKQTITLLLALAMIICCISADAEQGNDDYLANLVAAAQAEGELVVYGSCEEPYLNAACQKFNELYGIRITVARESTVKVQTMIAEEKGNPSADVWFGGTTDPYNEAAKDGLLEAYEARNATHLIDPIFRDPDGYWYGIYQGILGFMVNKEILSSRNLEVPKTWDDLIKPEYKGLIWLSNPEFSGTAKLIINTMVQIKGHDEAMKYLVELDKNVAQYTKAGSGPSVGVGRGDCAIGIGFLHDGISQILNGHDRIGLIIPEDGTSFEIGSTAIFKGCKHPNAAKLWIEYALSPECVELADDTKSFQYLVLDNAETPSALDAFPELDRTRTIDYDFTDAKENASKYVEDFYNALTEAGAAPDARFRDE